MDSNAGYRGAPVPARGARARSLPGPLAFAVLVSVLAAALSLTADKSAAAEQDYPDAFEVCTSCHSYHENEPPLVGPPLWGVVGRPVASVQGYDYSPALRALGGTWELARLDVFLTKPDAYVPGTRMDMGGIPDAGERAEVLEFLETLGPRVSAAREDAAGPP